MYVSPLYYITQAKIITAKVSINKLISISSLKILASKPAGLESLHAWKGLWIFHMMCFFNVKASDNNEGGAIANVAKRGLIIEFLLLYFAFKIAEDH